MLRIASHARTGRLTLSTLCPPSSQEERQRQAQEKAEEIARAQEATARREAERRDELRRRERERDEKVNQREREQEQERARRAKEERAKEEHRRRVAQQMEEQMQSHIQATLEKRREKDRAAKLLRVRWGQALASAAVVPFSSHCPSPLARAAAQKKQREEQRKKHEEAVLREEERQEAVERARRIEEYKCAVLPNPHPSLLSLTPCSSSQEAQDRGAAAEGERACAQA